MSAVLQTERPYTYEDLALLPDDGNRYEIINGELIVSPAPVVAHQFTQGAILGILFAYLEATGLGIVLGAPTDVRFSHFDSVQPDIVVVLNDRMEHVATKSVTGAPTLVVEVLSPGTRHVDIIKKQALYAAYGVPEYWLVDPTNQTIEVLVLENEAYRSQASLNALANPGASLSSVALPDFSFAISRVFQNSRHRP